MSDDVKLLPYDSRAALYQQLVDVTHVLGDKVRKGLAEVRKYPPPGLTRAYKAYAQTVIELARDAREERATSSGDRKPVYALSEEEFAAEMAQLTRHVVRAMPRSELQALLDEPAFEPAEREQGDAQDEE